MIKRYKSYRELSYMEPLSKGVNAIIGANGNGKSNFLDAIIFVLTDKYQNLRQEEKKLLLHEEPNDSTEDSEIITIELVLDNKSRRFPVDKDTVSIMKLYNTKENREELMINQKKLLKADVINLLESAGFTRSNPYYIIQQGKINAIINMSDFDYYEIFSEVTGTKTYEEKKEESLKLLEESKENRAKIEKQKKEINDYINRLETQCENLKEFEKLESKKKVYEAFVLNEQLAQFQIACEFLEERRKEQNEGLQLLSNAQLKYKQKVNEKMMLIAKMNKSAQLIRNKIERCNEELSNIETLKYQSEENLKLINDSKKNYFKDVNQINEEMNQINQEKIKYQQQLNNIDQKLNDLNREISNCQSEYNETKGKSDYILLKSQNERKEYLCAEIQKLQLYIKKINDNIVERQKEIINSTTKLNNLNKNNTNINTDIKNLSERLTAISNELVSSKNKRRDIVNEIKKNDIEENEINEDITQITDQIKKIELSFPLFEVFKAVTKIKNMKLPGVYGILLDLFHTDEKAKNAVDLIMGNKLYSLIVDTFETANKLIEINRKSNGPVITIIPIEFLSNQKSYVISQNSQQTVVYVPILNFVKIKQSFLDAYPEIPQEKAQMIIEKYLLNCMLVKNYEIGMKLAKEFKYTCVTSENEIINSGGYLTKMGYYDYEKQRDGLYEKYIESNDNLILLSNKLENISVSKNNLQNKENNIIRTQQSFLKEKIELSSKIEELTKEQNNIMVAIANLNQILSSQQNALDTLLNNKTQIEQKISVYNDILNNKIDIKTQSQNTQIFNNVTQLEQKILEMSKAKIELSKQKMQIESKLENDVIKREIELQANLNGLKFSDYSSNISTFNENEANSTIDMTTTELNLYKNSIVKYSNELNQIEVKIQSITNEISILNKESQTIAERVNQCEGELKGITLSLEEKNEKKNLLLKSIANLGSVDSEETEKLKKLKENALKAISNESSISVREQELKQERTLEPIYQKLEKIVQKMKKFEKINRFAIDDYKTFKQKKEEIEEKLNDLEEKQNEILNVVKVLDEKKENAVQTTFNKVNSSFVFFFKELVPNGIAKLTLSSENKMIHIAVSFTGSEENSQSMHQLSGGQKTAVAIALIFALSKIDPPPFYILDEVDAALDPSLRINLCKLIQNLSETNQFIISTFKPELLDTAENIYQVKFANKTSNIIKIERDEAKKFLKDNF